ncbi:MAG: hypothetical protein V4616_10645 [Bacteroidota bacterium]
MNRRHFIRTSGIAVTAACIPFSGFSFDTPQESQVMGLPGGVSAIIGGKETRLQSKDRLSWENGALKVKLSKTETSVAVEVQAPGVAIEEIRISWQVPSGGETVIMNDHWERTYADCAWESRTAETVLPWYYLEADHNKTYGCGVKTGSATFCSWRVNASGIQLVLDTRNGGNGTELGKRKLKAAEIVTIVSRDGETPFQTLKRFVRRMCDNPRLPKEPVYGINDWYYLYGDNSTEKILELTSFIAPLTEGLANRPFSVIDDGWFKTSPAGPEKKYTWAEDLNAPNSKFPDMKKLAADIKTAGMRPGLWTRPLAAPQSTPSNLRLPSISGKLRRFEDMPVLDPSIPENITKIKGYFKTYKDWGYEMIKFDFTSYDLFGRWGSTMVKEGAMTIPGWNMNDRSRTNAEIVLDLYKAIREASGNMYIISCNTFSHLCAGLFEVNRIGDDTSGEEWDRTRQYGVNTLAFRGVHHDVFYAADADCVGITSKIPWEKTKKWLELVAYSGTPLFVSPQPEAIGEEQKQVLREAFKAAASPMPLGEPLDWMDNKMPNRWKLNGKLRSFNWE